MITISGIWYKLQETKNLGPDLEEVYATGPLVARNFPEPARFCGPHFCFATCCATISVARSGKPIYYISILADGLYQIQEISIRGKGHLFFITVPTLPSSQFLHLGDTFKTKSKGKGKCA